MMPSAAKIGLNYTIYVIDGATWWSADCWKLLIFHIFYKLARLDHCWPSTV